jgi:hypothetical protein
MALHSGIGAILKPRSPQDMKWVASDTAWAFGEDQGRYVITSAPGAAERIIDRAEAAGVPIRPLGVTGGAALTLRAERPILVAQLRDSFEGWFPAYMAGRMA